MFLKYAVLIEACIVVHGSSSMACNTGGSSTEYDAWKFLESLKSGYIKYLTYEDPTACTLVMQTELNADNKSAVYEVASKDLADNTTQSGTFIYEVQYCPNQYVVFDTDGQELYNSTVAYSDFSNCSIIQGSESPALCVMFVNSGTSDEAISECKNKFPETCSSTRNDVFNQSICDQSP